MRSNRRLLLCSLVAVLPAIPGCGSSGMSSVTGTVTLDGKPLKDASVTFHPEGGGRYGTAHTDEDGYYELKYYRGKSGAPPGKYIVRISTADTTDEEKAIPEKVPDKYNIDAESNPKMKVEVEDGSNEFNFDLDSKGKITPPGERDKASDNPDTC